MDKGRLFSRIENWLLKIGNKRSKWRQWYIKQKDDARSKLVGHIENEKMYSELLKNKFESDILIKIEEYIEWIKIERSIKHTNYKTRLNGLWINRQKSGEHNPPHRHHNGEISFVIYLDFPQEIINEQPLSVRGYIELCIISIKKRYCTWSILFFTKLFLIYYLFF